MIEHLIGIFVTTAATHPLVTDVAHCERALEGALVELMGDPLGFAMVAATFSGQKEAFKVLKALNAVNPVGNVVILASHMNTLRLLAERDDEIASLREELVGLRAASAPVDF